VSFLVARSLLTTIRDLQRRRGRERRGLALAEGVRLLEEAVAARVTIRGAAVSPALEGTPRGKALKAALAQAGVSLVDVSDTELGDLADTTRPQGVVAVIEPRAWILKDVRMDRGSVALVLDGVQDPGNVGTMLRTALGLGATGVLALPGTAELTNPKVVRGSMGALFRLPAVETSPDDFLAWAEEGGVEICTTAADGDPIARAELGPRDRRPPLALVVGNEGAGTSDRIMAAARRRLAVPLSAGVESLNVAVAAGILLHEVTRAD
jgi:TrmH family RNA methyltransferase